MQPAADMVDWGQRESMSSNKLRSFERSGSGSCSGIYTWVLVKSLYVSSSLVGRIIVTVVIVAVIHGLVIIMFTGFY